MVEFAKLLSFKFCIYLVFVTWGLMIHWTIIPLSSQGVLYIIFSSSIDLAISCGGGFDSLHQSAAVSYRGSFDAFMLDKAALTIEKGGEIGSA